MKDSHKLKGAIGVLGLSAAAGLGAMNACRHAESPVAEQGSSTQSAVVGSGTDCQVETDSSIKDVYDAAKDPFRQKVLTTAGCKQIMALKDPYKITDFMKKAGCVPEARFIVSEKGVKAVTTESGIDPRTVDQWKCGNSTPTVQESPEVVDRVWISGPGSAMHIISWDRGSLSFNFYSADHPSAPNQIFFHGNSHVQATSVSNSFRHPCTNCHVGGGLLIRELHFPWPFWHSDITGLPGVETKKWSRARDAALPVRAVEQFEVSTIATLTSANQTLAEGLAHGKKFGSPLPQNPRAAAKYKDVLYPLFCERGIEVASSPNPSRGVIPWGLMINRLLVPRSGKIQLTAGLDAQHPRDSSRLDISGFSDTEDFAGLGTARNSIPGAIAEYGSEAKWTTAASQIFTAPGAGLGLQPLFPQRHFADDDLISRLVQQGIIPEDFAVNVLLVDLQNPVFSQTRCDLLQKIPSTVEIPADAAAVASQGQKIVAAFEAAVDADTNKGNPGSGAAKYLAMKSLGDKAKFVQDYANNCATNLADPLKAAKAMGIRWSGYKKPQPGIGSVFVGKDFNRGIEDFVEKAGVPTIKAGVKFGGITQSCDVK